MSWVPPFAIYTMKIPYVLGIHNVGRTVCDTIVNVIASMYRYARDVKASSHGNEKRNENSPFETLVRRTSGESSQRKSVYIRHLIAFDLKNPQRATIRFVKVNIVNIIRSDNTKPVLAQWNFLSDSIHLFLHFEQTVWTTSCLEAFRAIALGRLNRWNFSIFCQTFSTINKIPKDIFKVW